MSIKDYETRLAARVAEWEAKFPDAAAELRRSVLRESRLRIPPPTETFLAACVERVFREKVRELRGWPTEREWRAKQ